MSQQPTQTTEVEPEDPFMIPADSSQASANERASAAFELRKAGLPYDIVAEKVGYKSARSAERAVARILKGKRTARDIDAVLEMELTRLDSLQAVAWRRARQGDLAAIDRILKIMERRAQYLGLDRQAQQPSGEVHNTAIFIGGSQDEYITQLKAARDELRQARTGS